MNWKHAVVGGIAVGMLVSAGLIATAAGKASVRARTIVPSDPRSRPTPARECC